MSRSVGEDYLLALGRFLHTFSQVEAWAQFLLREYAKTDNQTSKALFSGVRLKDATSYIRRLHEAKGVELDSDLDDTMQQANQINSIRNDIIHHGALFDDEIGALTVSNEIVAHTPNHLRVIRVSADLLGDLNFDLNLIINRLRYFVINENPYVDAEHKSPKSAYPHYWQTPWRYKSAPQAPPQRKKPRRDKARRRQQKSSPQ